jgi:hypothetical protein
VFENLTAFTLLGPIEPFALFALFTYTGGWKSTLAAGCRVFKGAFPCLDIHHPTPIRLGGPRRPQRAKPQRQGGGSPPKRPPNTSVFRLTEFVNWSPTENSRRISSVKRNSSSSIRKTSTIISPNAGLRTHEGIRIEWSDEIHIIIDPNRRNRHRSVGRPLWRWRPLLSADP